MKANWQRQVVKHDGMYNWLRCRRNACNNQIKRFTCLQESIAKFSVSFPLLPWAHVTFDDAKLGILAWNIILDVIFYIIMKTSYLLSKVLQDKTEVKNVPEAGGLRSNDWLEKIETYFLWRNQSERSHKMVMNCASEVSSCPGKLYSLEVKATVSSWGKRSSSILFGRLPLDAQHRTDSPLFVCRSAH